MIKLSEGIKNVTSIFAANAAVQILSIVTAPIITRLYGPANFGEYQLFFSIAATIAAISSLGYEQAIIVPREDNEGQSAFVISLVLNVINSCVITAILLFLFFVLPQPIRIIFLFVGLSSFLDGIINVVNEWNTRTREFNAISKRRIISSSTGIGLKVWAGFAITTSAFGLIMGHVIEKLVYVALSFRELKRPDYQFDKMHRAILTQTAKKYIKFPKFYLPSILVNTFGNQMPIYFLAYLFGSTIVGLYALGYRVISYPLSLIGDALSRVFVQKIADQRHQNIDLRETLTLALRLLFKVGLFPTIVILLFADEIFGFVFGKDWAAAGTYVKILSIPMLLQFCFSPLSRIFNVLEFQKEGFVINNVQIFIKVLGIVVGYVIFRTEYGTILSLSIASVLSILIYAYWFFRLLHISSKVFLKSISWTIIIVFMYALPIIILSQLHFLSETFFSIITVLSATLYMVYVYRSESFLRGILNVKS